MTRATRGKATNGRPAAHAAPPREAFTRREWALIERLRTPAQVQAWLNGLPYNRELDGPTQRSFRGVVRTGQAHCMEAAMAAAVILEQWGFPPLVMSLESIDRLDHVIYVYRGPRGWGTVARSRDPGLHGRKPVFRGPRELALSYVDTYVDLTGRVIGYGLVDLRDLMGSYEWRLSSRNLWAVEQALIDLPHKPVRSSDRRIDALRVKYRDYLERFGRKPIYYDRTRWTPIPPEFTARRDPIRTRS